MTQQCQECSRRDSEIQRLRSEASTLLQAKLQEEEPLLEKWRASRENSSNMPLRATSSVDPGEARRRFSL
jgi:hypothetical protein